MAHVLLPSLFILQTDWPHWLWGETLCMCLHTCAFVPVPSSQPCTAPKRQTSRKRSQDEPDMSHLKRFCLSAVLWLTPSCCEHYCCLAAVREGVAADTPASSVSTDLHRTTVQSHWHDTFFQGGINPSALCPPPLPTFLRDMILLHTSNSVRLCRHSRQQWVLHCDLFLSFSSNTTDELSSTLNCANQPAAWVKFKNLSSGFELHVREKCA